ncbi:MAG: ATP-dependent DNA helicase RecG, partial [Gammaproteobacteria bacterium]|nr:ATP-dependent DNA helicase RecG [Gammaproteobacteria bacterium]
MKPVTALKGVGPRMAQRLNNLHLVSVQDVLFHLPLRYEDRTRVVPIGSLRPGDMAVIQGRVQLTEIKFGKRRMLLSRISDGTGSLTLRFFHFNQAQKESLARGVSLRCYGEVRSGATTLEMIHPEYKKLAEDQAVEVEETLTPVYPATEGVSQQTLRNLSDQALLMLDQVDLNELLPEAIRRERRMPTLHEALRYVHRPPPDAKLELLSEGMHPAQQRLAFEELLAQQVALRRLRLDVEHHEAPTLGGGGELRQRLWKGVPFSDTGDQQRGGA